MPDAACGRFPAGCDRGSICLTLLISAYDAAVGKPPVCALMRRARTGGFCILAAIPPRQRFVHLAARAGARLMGVLHSVVFAQCRTLITIQRAALLHISRVAGDADSVAQYVKRE